MPETRLGEARDAFLNRRRAAGYAGVFITVYGVILAVSLFLGTGLLNAIGKPIGTDFLAHYAGSRLALDGAAAAAYDNARILSVEARIIGAEAPPLYWLYPPTYLLLVLPLACFPYLLALGGWMALTGFGYLCAIRRIFPDRLTLPLTLAFPGTFQNLLQGQNGFLSSALLGGGLLLLPSRPLVGGMLLGLMSFKPQFAVLIPIALLAGRQWRALAGCIGGAAALIALSIVVFGWDIWIVYLQKMMFARDMLERDGAPLFPLFKAPTTFSLARMLGADHTTARILQGTVSIAVLAAVVRIWSRPALAPAIKAASLGVGCLLFTPYAYDYDLAILAIPIAFTAHHMAHSSREAWEEWVLVIAWITPLAFPIIAAATNLQLGPLPLMALLWVIVRRARI